MKPTKKRTAKKTDNPILTKLLKLKYRINDTARAEGDWSDDLSNDKNYGVPSDEYQKIVMDGANQVGMPEDELCNLQSWARGNKFQDNSS